MMVVALGVLRQKGLVTIQREGKHIVCSLAGKKPWRQCNCSTCTSAHQPQCKTDD